VWSNHLLPDSVRFSRHGIQEDGVAGLDTRRYDFYALSISLLHTL
jgi:hypothetical protein